MSRTDRMIGIGLGLAVGIVIVILFVYLGGTSGIDAPSLDSQDGVERDAERPREQGPER